MIQLFTERETSLIYEAQLFEEFALIKPRGAGLGSQIEKLGLVDFVHRFRDCDVCLDDVLFAEASSPVGVGKTLN